MTDTQPATSTARSDGEMRCFPCSVGNHGRCYQDPCQCATRRHQPPADWPAQTDGDPFALPVSDEGGDQ